MSMRQITLDGRLGMDAKVLKTNTGKDYVRFSIANDSYVDGTNKTEWFDVTCFDPFIVSKKSEYLKKGRYAIISGTWKSETVIKEGKAWMNHYVTANSIELPSFGRKDGGNDIQVSTFTGGTRSAEVVNNEKPAPKPIAEPKMSAMQSSPVGWGNDDDLPF